MHNQSAVSVLDRDTLLTVDELAAREKVTKSTVYKWHQRGQAPRRFRAGKRMLYRLSDIVEWENSRYVGGPNRDGN